MHVSAPGAGRAVPGAGVIAAAPSEPRCPSGPAGAGLTGRRLPPRRRGPRGNCHHTKRCTHLCHTKRLDLDSPRDYPEEDRVVFRYTCVHQDVVGRVRRVIKRVLGRRKKGGSSRMSPGVSGIIFPARRLPDRGLIRVRRTGRGSCLFWSGEGFASGPTAAGAFSAGSDRLVLEALL